MSTICQRFYSSLPYNVKNYYVFEVLMEYETALKKMDKGTGVRLPTHSGAGYVAEHHRGLGNIVTLGQKEVEIVCRRCGTHLLGVLASLEDPETITIYPGHHIVE